MVEKEFITFQPMSALTELTNTQKITGRKISCIEVNRDTAARVHLIAPSMPNLYIIFKSSDYGIIDSISHLNHIFLSIDYEFHQNKYVEYEVEEINMSSVKDIVVITASQSKEEVQNIFFDAHFPYIEELSGKKWYTTKDEEFHKRFKDKIEFLLGIQPAIFPVMMPTTLRDYDKAMDLIYRYFAYED